MAIEILKQRAAPMLKVESSVMAMSREQATDLFSQAMQRLLDIGKWHKLPCSLLSALKLTDAKGQEVTDRPVRENDYFVVKDDNGEGEWVKVEKIFLQRNASGPREVLAIRARGVHPFESCSESAGPSNTFKVMRNGLYVTAVVYGQNKEDELNLLGLHHKLGRPDSTVGAIPGVARVQWRSLVNGILSTWKE